MWACKACWGIPAQGFKGRLHRGARFTFSLKYLTYFFFNHRLCAKLLDMESGEERRANQSSVCFLDWVPLGSRRLIPLIEFTRWFFFFIYLRYVLKKKERQKSYPERNTFFFFSHGKEHSVVFGDWMKFCQWVHRGKALKFSQTY